MEQIGNDLDVQSENKQALHVIPIAVVETVNLFQFLRQKERQIHGF